MFNPAPNEMAKEKMARKILAAGNNHSGKQSREDVF
jgi:hypothetical protein